MEKFTKHDQEKANLEILFDTGDALIEVANVMNYGATKYDRKNWAKVDDKRRYISASMRHLLAYSKGEQLDESGYHHLAHSVCSLMFLLELEKNPQSLEIQEKTNSLELIEKCYSIKKHSPDEISLNGIVMKIPENIKKAGTDYFIYLDELQGYYYISDTKLNDKLVGGFHYGLIPEDFEAINNISTKKAKKIAGINKYSIYHKYHRPNCDPRGVVYIPKLNIWLDDYLVDSEYDKFGYSRAGGNILAGYEANGRKLPDGCESFLYKDFEDMAKRFNKRMITKAEFQVAMHGVKENDSARDNCDGTIKFTPDFTSKYGIIQATGHQWIWSADKVKGYENERAVVLGGYRDNEAYAGSRASSWGIYVWSSGWVVGCRFACDHMTPEQMSESEFE